MKKIIFLIFLCFAAKSFGQKVNNVYVESNKFTDYFPKDAVKEASIYRYNKDRNLTLVFTVKSDSIVNIRYNIDSKEKNLYLRKDTKNLYCIEPDLSQKKFDKIIEKILNILNN